MGGSQVKGEGALSSSHPDPKVQGLEQVEGDSPILRHQGRFPCSRFPVIPQPR